MQNRYVKSSVKRAELSQQTFSMDHVVAEFTAVTQSPSQAFIESYKAMLKTASRVRHHGKQYSRQVSEKHAAMVNALAEVERHVIQAEQARMQFQVSSDILELYSKEIRKIRMAEHHIGMIDSGMRLAKWRHRKISIEAEISELNKKLHCCKELDNYVKADELRDKYRDDMAGAGCFGKKEARTRYEQQDDFVRRLQQAYNENEYRVQIDKLKVQLKQVEHKIELYTHHAGEMTDDQRAVIRSSETRIEEITQLIQQQFIAHYSHAEPACMKEMVRLYAMFMQYRNAYDHKHVLTDAKQQLDVCMRELRCMDFKGTDALGVYHHFVSSLGFDADRIVVRDDDFAKLDNVLRIPFSVHAHTQKSVVSSHATMFTTTIKTSEVAESTKTKRAMFAASKQQNANPLPVNDKGKEEERDSVTQIGLR